MDILLATLLTCDEAKGLIDKIAPSTQYRTELVQMVKGSTYGCIWDAKAD